MALCKLHEVRHHIRTGQYACVGHRPPNSPTYGDLYYPNSGEAITQAYINNLRNIIRLEFERWAQHVDTHPVGAGPTGTTPASSSYQGTLISPDLSAIPGKDVARKEHINNPLTGINRIDSVGAVGHSLQYPPQNPLAMPFFKPGPSDDVQPSLADFVKMTGEYIQRSDIVQLIDQYRAIRMDCICHSDCMCNNVCNCHSDCGCHYSDMRLKKEIQYC